MELIILAILCIAWLVGFFVIEKENQKLKSENQKKSREIKKLNVIIEMCKGEKND